ncbi:hypothetical protein DLJ59_05110 [Micromonospora inaquosa]|uniref:Resolvase/invertase-type recombinase catalytic domain-containing protein n=2 Tax=Micromonospora inaquosa TaxID=2203716 RepID=A0A3N9XIF3_9ACTN|nr:hypothetical protein DLJ59_05110 [Micromonospora inaquosa]
MWEVLMQYTPELDGPDLLGWWIRQPPRRGRPRTRYQATSKPLGIPFAFYGRMSTREFQDRLSSARWQPDFAEDVIDGRGVIVAEFFDVGESRQVPWTRRPQAARPLAALADPGRGFDAVVVGEFERAFYGNQFRDLAPLFNLYGVQLWLPAWQRMKKIVNSSQPLRQVTTWLAGSQGQQPQS